MSNKKIISISLIILVLLAVTFLFLIDKNNQNKLADSLFNKPVAIAELMTDEEKNELSLYHLAIYEVLARDDSGKIITYQLVGMEEPKKIVPEFINETEKTELDISPETKIQVLKRDQNGKVSAYKIINDDSDIIKEY